jgi:probable phosphomutase (TIGR03848 family)
MTQILLIRHAVNDFVKTGKLAGWTPGVHLNEEGQAQAQALGKRLADTPIDFLYASPLERTMETAEAIRQHHPNLTIQQTTELGEVRYGDWEGMEINKLTGRKMWQVVQQYPSRAEFPNGETMRGVQTRAVNAVEALVTAHPRETVAVVTHADIIKMVLAHFLGMHLDEFQRIVITPASISVLSLGFGRPYVGTMNDMAHILQMEQERKQAKQAEKTA